jgi:hypothetical protein
VIAGAYLLEIIGVAIAFGNVYNNNQSGANHVGGSLPITGISSGGDGKGGLIFSLNDAFDTTELTTVEIASLLAPALLLLAMTIVLPHVSNTVSQVFVFWLNVAVGIWASIVLLKMIMALVWYSTVASILVAPPTPSPTVTTPFPTQAFPTPPPPTLDPSVNLTVAAVYFFAGAMGLVVAGSVIVFRRSSAVDKDSPAPQAKEMVSTVT